MRTFLGIGAVVMAIAVGAGAFGAHGLKSVLSPERLVTWETAARYTAYHGLGLFAVAFALAHGAGRWARAAGWLHVSGLLLFCGSLYGYAVTEVVTLARITPVGGVCFLAGWIALAVGAWRLRTHVG